MYYTAHIINLIMIIILIILIIIIMILIMILILIIMITIMLTRYASEFLQNVSVGRHRQCGDSQSNVIIEEFKDSREVMIMVKIMIFGLITMVILIMIAWRW